MIENLNALAQKADRPCNDDEAGGVNDNMENKDSNGEH
jgi:hypothetical protein